MRPALARALVGLCALTWLVLCAPPVRAQSASDKAAAQALFDEGRKALAAGKNAVACTKLEQSQRIDPAIGTLLYLGECYKRMGRTASAWATFREGASEAQAAGEAERARLGTEEANKLQPKLSMLSVAVAPANKALTDFKVLRGKDKVPRSLWGVEVPVDPGKIAIVASAPGYKMWRKTVTVGANAAHAKVTVPPLKPGPPVKHKPKPETPKPAPTAPASPPPPPRWVGSDGTTQRVIGVVVGTVGLAGIGVGSYFGLRAISKNKDAKQYCPGGGNVCNAQEGVTLTNDAKTAATISDIAFGAGAALFVGGVVLFLTAPSKHLEKVGRLHLAPELVPGGSGVAFGGSF